jgi:hypothetical protein
MCATVEVTVTLIGRAPGSAGGHGRRHQLTLGRFPDLGVTVCEEGRLRGHQGVLALGCGGSLAFYQPPPLGLAAAGFPFLEGFDLPELLRATA